METHALPEKLDYIRLVFRCDAEMFQNDYLPRINTLLLAAQRAVGESPKFEINLNGRSGRRESYFEVNIWGDQADYFAASMPVVWWGALTRIDYRLSEPSLSLANIQDIVSHYNQFPPTRHIFDTFNRPNAAKTNKRDAGGRGFRVGSRASKNHLVAYIRKGGYGALEYRKGNKASQDLGKLVANWDGGSSPIEPYALAMNMMRADAALFMHESMGAATLSGVLAKVELTKRGVLKEQRRQDVMELLDAEDWFASLPASERDAMQDLRWWPSDAENPNG